MKRTELVVWLFDTLLEDEMDAVKAGNNLLDRGLEDMDGCVNSLS